MPRPHLNLLEALRAAGLALALAVGGAPHGAVAQTVTSFTVVNAVTGADISTFTTSGEVSRDTPDINVRANATGARSVVFTDGTGKRIENTAPFAYKGDSGGTYFKWQPAAGIYVIQATPYAGPNGTGLAGTPTTLSLTIKPTRNEAARFLARATFGPTQASIDEVISLGYGGWIDKQFNETASAHRATYDAAFEYPPCKALDSPCRRPFGGQILVANGFWKHALTGQDQLRQRVAFALSQIFVISIADGELQQQPRAMAHWLDMLGDKGLTTYRELLEAVTLHPMMGLYLDSLRNQKADGNGRLPDLNFAREITQLFSIGVHELNQDGTLVLVDGSPVDAYTPSDLSALSRVFTGFSWACERPSDQCFHASPSAPMDPDRSFRPMRAYPAHHSQEEKVFLGTTIPARTGAETLESQLNDLKQALDTLANHKNTPPFISKQLIQRLVTSNPTREYVAHVADVFKRTGGDMKAVIKAILTYDKSFASNNNVAKLREPVLALSAYLRAFEHTSVSGAWKLPNTESPVLALGQMPLRAPSVFNFFRPGYVAPNSATAAAGLVSPEQQLLNETSAAGWVNFMRDNIFLGAGVNKDLITGVVASRRDLQRNWTPEMAVASNPVRLTNHVNDRLLYGQMSPGLRSEIQTTLATIVIPVLLPNGSNKAAVDNILRLRVQTAVLLTVVSPEFRVQK